MKRCQPSYELPKNITENYNQLDSIKSEQRIYLSNLNAELEIIFCISLNIVEYYNTVDVLGADRNTICILADERGGERSRKLPP